MPTHQALKPNIGTVQLYEVVRVIEGIPIFLEDHLGRLYRSAQLTGFENLPGFNLLAEKVDGFIAQEDKKTGNIRLSFSFSGPSSEPECLISFITHYYPTPVEYDKGVKVGLINADRPVPHAKVIHNGIGERANRAMADNGLFEALLVDANGNITEGSRSNVFFIKGEKLYSAPTEKILQGITRNKVLEICKTAAIEVIETDIPANGLDLFNAAFLTGTSPKVLPISSIEGVRYPTKLPLLIKLQDYYNKLIDRYIQSKR